MILLGLIYLHAYIYVYGAIGTILLALYKNKERARNNILKVSFVVTILFEIFMAYVYHHDFNRYGNTFFLNTIIFRCISLLIGFLPILWMLGFNKIIDFTNKNRSKNSENKIMKGDN